MQIVAQLSFCTLFLMWLFASFQILSTGCVSSSQDFLGCTITKKVEEHWYKLHKTDVFKYTLTFERIPTALDSLRAKLLMQSLKDKELPKIRPEYFDMLTEGG